MKRRHFVGSIPFLFATPEVLGQAIANIQQIPGFFTPPQLAALRHLSDIIMPAIGGAPGALDAGAPEFLDFLVGQSPTPSKNLYRTGLDTLNMRASTKYGKAFAAVAPEQADELLATLHDAWTYEEPRDPFAQNLQHAKTDKQTTTQNTRKRHTTTKHNRNGAYW